MGAVRPQLRRGAECWRCGLRVERCPHCGHPYRGAAEWLREYGHRYPALAASNLYAADLDAVILAAWHYRRTPAVLSLHELKTAGGLPDRYQIETLCILDALLAAGSRSLAAVRTLRGVRAVRYGGAYVHSFHPRVLHDGRRVGGHDPTDSPAVTVYRVAGPDRLVPIRTYRLPDEEPAYAAFLAAGGAEPPIPAAVEIRRGAGGLVTVQLTLRLADEEVAAA